MVQITSSIRRLERLKESGGLTREQIEEIDCVIRDLNTYNQDVGMSASREY